nr:hypothetical protein Iba_scaffold11619CG0300 [Ipomoea batatas]
MGWEMVGCPNYFPDADPVTCISVRIALVQTTLARVSFLEHESTLWFISFIYLGSGRLGLDHRGCLDYLDPCNLLGLWATGSQVPIIGPFLISPSSVPTLRVARIRQ